MNGIITEYCTGCRACEQLCARKAIEMKPNAEGFLEPVVNKTKCINCDLCIKRCPQNGEVGKHGTIETFAVRDKIDKELRHSASGGAFAVVARNVLKNGGYVVGAAYVNHFKVKHIVINQIEDLQQLQSSKYVQSNTEQTYTEVEQLLKIGKQVLYSGTPCQVGGLKSYLHKEYSNLLTIEVICHGVPSPKLFAKYINWLESKMHGKLVSYNFRDKAYGWGLDYMTKTKTKTKTKSNVLDPYYTYFLRGNTYRECCYKCKYCTPQRVSDFTIGDYWGIEKEHPEFNSIKGVSCLLINTPKGADYWAQNKDAFFFLKSSFEKVAKINHNLRYPTPRPAIRDRVYKHIDDMNDREFFATQMPIPYNYKARIKAMIPISIRRFIKTKVLTRINKT